jgi:hypothetical protein
MPKLYFNVAGPCHAEQRKPFFNNVIIFGAGHYGKLALEHYGIDAVKFFCDNNPSKVGQIYCEKKIISLEQLKDMRLDYQIIIAVQNLKTYFQIAKQLALSGIENYSPFTEEDINYNSYKEIKSKPILKIKENKMNYARNKKLLHNYPYLFGKIPEFKYLQSKALNLDEDIPYFFKDLSKPLFIRNLSHPVHIKFLFDNVRSSEDVAMDNHIYLQYENEQKFLEMLCQCDLKLLLKSQKFIFLIGKQNKDIYPIDFKKKYGIDYASMPFKPLRASELKRIVLYCNHTLSGQDFLFQVSAANRNILPILAPVPFRYLPKLKKEILKLKFNINDLFILRSYFFNGFYSLSDPEIFRSISMLLHNNMEERERISPTILFDPHVPFDYRLKNVYKSFLYRKCIGLIRNPATRFASIAKSKFFDVDISDNDFYFTPLYNSLYFFGQDEFNCFKLESLKDNQAKGARALCKYFQVPFDKNMLHPEKIPYIAASNSSTGKMVMGFEPTPRQDISEFLSEFDLQRLMPIWEPILRYYGYECKKYAPLKESDLRKIYSEPFKFEKRARISDRDLFTEVMLYLYNLAKSGKYYLPPLIDV